LEGDIAAAKVYEFQQQLPGLTHGEGALTSAFEGYLPMRGEPPSRPRTMRDARNREEYLRDVLRRF
jgi:ribosomal protection tetracycline resistance protein